MQLGDWQLDTVSGGRFLIDGGTMFGVVPKGIWQRSFPPDDANRIRNDTKCVLARNGRTTLLIDTGYGGEHGARERKNYALEEGEPLVRSLAAVGVTPEEVDLVVFSHLHFDHAGGATRGAATTVFPRAKFIVQRTEWDDAFSNRPELRGAYYPERLAPLASSGRLEFVEGDVEVAAGVRTLVTGGHTRGHQAIVLESHGETALFLGDLCPMTSHVRSLWCMAYDLYPLEVRRRRPQLLGQAADEGWWLLWDHDPDVAASRIRRDDDREFAIVDPRETL